MKLCGLLARLRALLGGRASDRPVYEPDLRGKGFSPETLAAFHARTEERAKAKDRKP